MKLDIRKHFSETMERVWGNGSEINSLSRDEVQALVIHLEQLLGAYSDRVLPEELMKLSIIMGDTLVRNGDYEHSLQYFHKAKSLAEYSNDTYHKIKAVNGIAINYMVHGNFPLGIEAWESILDDITEQRQKADMYNNLGIAYSMNDQYQKALEYHYASLRIDEDMALEAEIGINYVNLANCYWRLLQHDKCLDLYLLATEKFLKLGNKRYLSSSYANISNVYTEMREFDKALEYALLSLELKKEYANELENALTIVRLGNIYRYLKDYPKALQHMKQAYEIFAKAGDMHSMAEVNLTIGFTYYDMGDIASSKSYTLIGLEQAKQNNNQNVLMGAYQHLYAIFTKKRQYKEALAALEKHLELYKKIFRENPKLMVAQSEVDYYRKKTEESLEYYRLSNIELQDKNRIISQKSKQLNSLNIELEKNNDFLSKLVSVIAHDIRGPISSVSQAIKMIRDKSFNPSEIEELLNEIPITVDNALDIINDILLWIRKQKPQKKLQLSPVNVSPLLQEAIELYENMARLKDVRFVLNLDFDCQALSESSLLRIVFRNLINNAIKFSPHGSDITISIRRKQRYSYVDIADQGCGLTDDKIKSLLDPKAGNKAYSSTELTGGFGIRLCLDFLGQTKGKLEIKSHAGKGSVFSVRLLNPH